MYLEENTGLLHDSLLLTENTINSIFYNLYMLCKSY